MVMSKVKVLSRPIKGIEFYGVNLVPSKKYPETMLHIRARDPVFGWSAFAIGEYEKKAEPSIDNPAMMNIYIKLNTEYDPTNWEWWWETKYSSGTRKQGLLRIEVLPPKRKIEKPENLPTLIVYFTVTDSYRHYLYYSKSSVSIEDSNKYKLIVSGRKCSASEKNCSSAFVVLAWDRVLIKKETFVKKGFYSEEMKYDVIVADGVVK